MITTVTDIGVQAATKHVVALAYLAVVRRLARRAETPPGFRNRAPHFGGVEHPLFTFRTLVDAVSWIALALFGQTFAFVCAPLALVGSARRGQIWGNLPTLLRPRSATIRR
jgi:hypothetical protein